MTNDATIPTKTEQLTKNLWFMQAGLGLVIVELLVLFGAKALGLSNWIGPSLLLVLAFFGMRYLFTANLRAVALIGAAAVVLFVGLLLI